MWETNKDVRFVYSTIGSQQFWALFTGTSGWKRVKTGSPDGVANVAEILTTAKMHGRKVNVFLQGNPVSASEGSSSRHRFSPAGRTQSSGEPADRESAEPASAYPGSAPTVGKQRYDSLHLRAP